MPIRSEAPLTIPSTPEVLKKSKAKHPEAEKFVSMAESVAQFTSRTPPRFHVAPAKAQFQPVAAQRRLRVTRAQSPKFHAMHRRTRHVKSAQELEEEIMSNIKPFKAQPIPADVLESKGDVGVPRIVSKDITVPMEFNFATQKRAEMRPKAPEMVEDNEFKAQPMPAKVFEAVVGVPQKSSKKTTVPKTPKLTKPAPRPEPKEEEIPIFEFRAQPLPDGQAVFRPQLLHQHTQPEAFTVAAKDPKVKRQKLYEDTVRTEAQLREFKANGIPSLSPELPLVEAKASTVPEPFEMPGAQISKRKRRDFEDKLMQQQQKMQEEAQFHAQPCLSTVLAPFHTKKSDKPLTEVDLNASELNTEKRAVTRSMFDQHLREKSKMEEEQQAALEVMRAEQDKKDVALLRKARETKAHSIRYYKDIAPAKTVPLTEPHTPAFSKRIRLA